MTFKILSVDDSRTIRMIVSKAFKTYDCELFEAENGIEGLDLAAKEKPDLIILDITMPVMTGIEMLAKLKQDSDLKHIPVIMLTAESGKDNVMQIVKMGVKDYIVKPFKGEQLIDRAKYILALKPRIDLNEEKKGNATPNFFSADGDIVLLKLPEKITRSVSTQIEAGLKNKISQMHAAGASKFIMVMSRLNDIGVTAIQLIISVVTTCIRSKLKICIVGSENQIEAIKGFKETSAIPVSSSLEAAKTTI